MSGEPPAYLNACSHGLPSDAVRGAMVAYLELEDRDGPVAAFRATADQIALLYERAGSLLGAPADEVHLCGTTTAGWLEAVMGLRLAGGRILVAPHEWGANVRVLERLAAQCGTRIEVLPDPTGDRAPQAWAERIDDDVRAIFSPMVSSIEGRRYPIEEISRLPRPEGCRLIIDGAQAVGQIPIDLGKITCDAFVATARKWLCAPRGTALAWYSPAMGVPTTPRDVEPTDMTVAAMMGLRVALDEALEAGGTRRAARLADLCKEVTADLAELGYAPLHGEKAMTGACAFLVPADRVERVKAALSSARVIVKFPDPSRDEPHAPRVPSGAVMRVAPHSYNSERDIERLVDALAGVA